MENLQTQTNETPVASEAPEPGTQDPLAPVDNKAILDNFENAINNPGETDPKGDTHEPNNPEANPVNPEAETPAEETETPKRKKKGIFNNDDVPESPETPETETPETVAKPEDEFANAQYPSKAAEWKQVKEANKKALDEKDTRISELEKASNDSSLNSPEYKEMVEQNKQMRERLNQVDLQSSPDFTEKYTNPKTDLVKKMATIITENELEVDLGQLLSKSGKDLTDSVSAVLDDLPTLSSGQFQRAYERLFELHQEESAAISNADQTRQDMKTSQVFNQEQVMQQTWSEYTDKGNAFLDLIEPDNSDSKEDKLSADKYNNAVSAILPNATALSTANLDEKGISDICIRAAFGDFLAGEGMDRMEFEFGVMKEENAAMKKKLSAIEAANPMVNGTRETLATKRAPEAPKTADDALSMFDENIRKAGL